MLALEATSGSLEPTVVTTFDKSAAPDSKSETCGVYFFCLVDTTTVGGGVTTTGVGGGVATGGGGAGTTAATLGSSRDFRPCCENFVKI